MERDIDARTHSNLVEYYQREDQLVGISQKIDLFPMALKSGRGATLKDVDDKEYIDFSSGDCVANIGYCHPYLVKAVSEQVATLNHSMAVRYPGGPNLALAARLIELAPMDYHKKVLFASSGSDACEAAGKLAKAFTKRPRLIANMGGVHGFGLGNMSMTSFPGYSGFITTSDSTKVPYAYCYRCPVGHKYGSCSLECLSYVEDYVFRTACDPDQVAAWIIEAEQGDSGFIAPPLEYLRGVERICRKHGILLVLDEVLMGLGRSGKLFAFEHFGISPDMVVLGKSLGAGIPIGVVVGRAEVLDSMPGKLLNSTLGSLIGSAAGLAVLDAIRDNRLVENAASQGDYLIRRLDGLKSKYSSIGDIRGLGLGIGVEIVDRRDGKSPDAGLALLITKEAVRNGLLFCPFGYHMNVLMIAPPLVITREQAEQGVQILDAALAQAEAL